MNVNSATFNDFLERGLKNPGISAGLNKNINNVKEAVVDGESTMARRDCVAVPGMSNSDLRLTYFTAMKTEVIRRVRLISAGTAAVGTTFARVGIYEENADGSAITLVASIANDPTLFNAGNQTFWRDLITPFEKVAGRRYAVGLLMIGATTLPLLHGSSSFNSGELAQPPRLSGFVTGQVDLPATLANGVISQSSLQFYSVLVP